MNREIPAVLWIALITLGLFTVIQLLIGISCGHLGLLISVAVNLLVLYGLYHGHRWAFVVTLLFGILAFLVSVARNPVVGIFTLVLNGLVLVPMILAKGYFWLDTQPRRSVINFCGRCGHDLRNVDSQHCPYCGRVIRRPGQPARS